MEVTTPEDVAESSPKAEKEGGSCDAPASKPEAFLDHDELRESLESAIAAAAAAGRFDVVVQLARILEARDRKATPNVVTLDTKRGSR